MFSDGSGPSKVSSARLAKLLSPRAHYVNISQSGRFGGGGIIARNDRDPPGSEARLMGHHGRHYFLKPSLRGINATLIFESSLSSKDFPKSLKEGEVI